MEEQIFFYIPNDSTSDRPLDAVRFYTRNLAIAELEHTFDEYPGFREFAMKVELVCKRPWQRVASFTYHSPDTDADSQSLEHCTLSDEESEMLWPLMGISGEHASTELLTVCRRIWSAHKPDVDIANFLRQQDSGENDSSREQV